ncbi:hypothetical protein J3F84DRAFT_361908 [Trichoderma pleuroticola]
MKQNEAIATCLGTIRTSLQNIFKDIDQLTQRISAAELRIAMLTLAFEQGDDESERQREGLEQDLLDCWQLTGEIGQRLVECERRETMVRDHVIALKEHEGLDWPSESDL